MLPAIVSALHAGNVGNEGQKGSDQDEHAMK
jgi:hypothetical protein